MTTFLLKNSPGLFQFMNALESWFLTFTKSNFLQRWRIYFTFEPRQRLVFQHFVKVLCKCKGSCELKYRVHGCSYWVFGFLTHKCTDVWKGVWVFKRDVWVYQRMSGFFHGAWVFWEVRMFEWEVRVQVLFVSPTNPHNLGYKKKLPVATTFSFSNVQCFLIPGLQWARWTVNLLKFLPINILSSSCFTKLKTTIISCYAQVSWVVNDFARTRFL